MSDRYVQGTKYQYSLNSNLVISGGRGGGPNENEPSGEGDTLAGKKLATFGDRAQRERPPEVIAQEKMKRAQDAASKNATKKKKDT